MNGIDFDIKEAVAKLELFGISTSPYKPKMLDMPLNSERNNPSEWCKKMMDEAKDGDEAMNYFELMNVWREREEKK